MHKGHNLWQTRSGFLHGHSKKIRTLAEAIIQGGSLTMLKGIAYQIHFFFLMTVLVIRFLKKGKAKVTPCMYKTI